MRTVADERTDAPSRGMKILGPLSEWTIIELVIGIALGIVLSQILMLFLKAFLLATGLSMLGVDPMQ